MCVNNLSGVVAWECNQDFMSGMFSPLLPSFPSPSFPNLSFFPATFCSLSVRRKVTPLNPARCLGSAVSSLRLPPAGTRPIPGRKYILPRCMECRRGLAMRILSVRLTLSYFVFSPNSIALLANYVTMVEDRPIMTDALSIVSQFQSSTFGHN